MPKAYKVLVDRILRGETMAKAGDIVYDQMGPDYGLANDDTRDTGVEHISVTKNDDGGYPGFTIPATDLKPLSPAEEGLIALDKLTARAHLYNDEEDSFGIGAKQITLWSATVRKALEADKNGHT